MTWTKLDPDNVRTRPAHKQWVVVRLNNGDLVDADTMYDRIYRDDNDEEIPLSQIDAWRRRCYEEVD